MARFGRSFPVPWRSHHRRSSLTPAGSALATYTAAWSSPTIIVPAAGAATATYTAAWASPTIGGPPATAGNLFPLIYRPQVEHTIHVIVGVPAAAMGNNGDYAFRKDGSPGARMYVRASGSWTAIN